MKYILIYLPALLLLSCSRSSSTTNDNTSVKNIELVNQLYGHFNKHNWQAMAALYSENAEFLDPSLATAPVMRNREQITKKYSELHQIFADIHDKITSISAAGNNDVVVEFISTGAAPDSSQLYLPICSIYHIEKGFITKDHTCYNNPE